jgi:hypothetical protein
MKYDKGLIMLRLSLFFLVVSLFLTQTTWPQTPNYSPTAREGSLHDTTGAPSDRSERFDLLTLEGSHLEPRQPLLLDKAVLPEFTRELWQVQWRSGDPIDLYIIKPANIQRPPVVLFLYSYPADTDRFRDDAYCKTVTKYGFAAVGFVSALTGQRYHDRPWKQWFISELPESLATTVHDVQMILNYLGSRSDLDSTHAGMFGQGSGGTIAILAAASDSRLKAIDVLDPWGDWSDWFQQSSFIDDQQRPQFTDPAFLARVAYLDPVVWLPKLQNKTLRLQETLFDLNTPNIAKEHLTAVLGRNSDIIRYSSIEDYKERAATNGNILAWLGHQIDLGK